MSARVASAVPLSSLWECEGAEKPLSEKASSFLLDTLAPKPKTTDIPATLVRNTASAELQQGQQQSTTYQIGHPKSDIISPLPRVSVRLTGLVYTFPFRIPFQKCPYKILLLPNWCRVFRVQIFNCAHF